MDSWPPRFEGAVSEADWGSVLPLAAHPLHRFAVPLPLWGRQERCGVKPDQLFKDYADVDHEKLRANLKYFLEAIMPTCEGRWSTIPTTA